MKIYLTRHGQVPSNIIGRFNPKDEDLTDKGIEQAENLRSLIETIDYDVIISSPYLRATHTAELINVKNKPILEDERLKERDAGNLIGQSLNVVDREEYWNYNSDTIFSNEEKIKGFFSRIENFLEDLKSKDYNSVLIVAHSGISKAFSAYFDGIEDGRFLNRGIANCEIKEYYLKGAYEEEN